jgi:hypothetical protein
MQCRRFEKWLFLYRDGELDAAQSVALADHLNRCEACRALMAEIMNTDEMVSLLRKEQPAVESPGQLTDNVLNRVRAESRAERIAGRKNNRTFSLWALAGAVSFAAALFFIQQSGIYMKVARLEARMAAIDRGGHAGRRSVAADIQKMIGRSPLPSFQKSGFASTDEDLILVRKDLLMLLLDSNRAMNEQLEKLNRVIQGIPELRNVNLDDGLNVQEYRLLSAHQNEVMKMIERVL